MNDADAALLDTIMRLGVTCNHVEKLGAEEAARWKTTIMEYRKGTTHGDYWVCHVCGTDAHPASLPVSIR